MTAAPYQPCPLLRLSLRHLSLRHLSLHRLLLPLLLSLVLLPAALLAAPAPNAEPPAVLCLVCQNQTLAESNAPLAQDMRNLIRGQLADGKTDAQIMRFFEDRYGDFVRYDPPFKPVTWLLWLGPFALLALGFLVRWIDIELIVKRGRSCATIAGIGLGHQRRSYSITRQLVRNAILPQLATH